MGAQERRSLKKVGKERGEIGGGKEGERVRGEEREG